MAKQDKLTVYGVGDICIDGQDNHDVILAHTASTIKEADIAFCQLEAVLSERGAPLPQARKAIRNSPKMASVLKKAGFDVISLASNHCMDLGADALSDTFEVLRKENLSIVGAGQNIAEARKPVIIEQKGTRVAFIAYNSILPYGYEADDERAGCAPIRGLTLYQQIEHDQPGTPCEVYSYAYPPDLEAMKEDIKKVRAEADIVIASMHWGLHFIPAALAMYQKEVAYAAIDAGVDLILGTHAHILKGIEIYKGKVIFYSLGNFAWRLGFPPGAWQSPRLSILLKLHPGWKLDPEYPTYIFPPDSRKTILVKCTISDKKIERVSFLPVMVNKQSQPEILSRQDKRSTEVLEYMQWLCQDQNLDTKLSFDKDNEILIHI